MPTVAMKNIGTVVLTEQKSGHGVVHKNTPLVHLNYFDGMFMRAEHLRLEQAGLRNLNHLSNQAGGHGIVYGFDTSLVDGAIRLGEGMAIDTAGRVLFMPDAVDIGINDLIARSTGKRPARLSQAHESRGGGDRFDDCVLAGATEPGTVVEGVTYHIITVSHIEALCGEEDVYGRLCEEACITSSDRPYLLEGVVVRAESLPPGLVLPNSSAVAMEGVHLRSRLASAYFEYERQVIADLISAEGLSRGTWCRGAQLPGGITSGVPVALLARTGSRTLFLDRWTVARERMEAPPRRYWAHIMAMRPWNIFLAQVLQFQCQLNKLFQGGGGGSGEDPCADAHGIIRHASEQVTMLLRKYESSRATAEPLEADPLALALKNVATMLGKGTSKGQLPTQRLLILGGIVELPSAGYLPVRPDINLSINEQVRRLMGEGVDLRFCAVRPDFVPHALEEAQHMERISLLEGLDDPHRKPKVDILVPDGELVESNVMDNGTAYEMGMIWPVTMPGFLISLLLGEHDGDPLTAFIQQLRDAANAQLLLRFAGAARGERLSGGGFGFHFAGQVKNNGTEGPPAFTLIELLQRSAVWLSAELAQDPFSMAGNESSAIQGEMVLGFGSGSLRSEFNGDLRVVGSEDRAGGQRVFAKLTASLTSILQPPAGGEQKLHTLQVIEQVEIARDSGAGSRPDVGVLFPRTHFLNGSKDPVQFVSPRKWKSPSIATVSGLVGALDPPLINVNDAQEFEKIFSAPQKIDPAVRNPTHPAHTSAVDALRTIAEALHTPQFEDTALRKLFPPAAATTDGVQVRAATDWVLFHRRRDKNCGGEIAPRAEVSTRKYRVYWVQFRRHEDVNLLHAALVENNAAVIARLKPVEVGVVAFAAGEEALASPPDAIRAAWQDRVSTGVALLFGVVASTGAVLEEGEVLARGRLLQLREVLTEVTPAWGMQVVDALESVPEGPLISASPHDGVMVMGTIPAMVDVRTDRQRVLRVATEAAAVAAILTSIKEANQAEVVPLLESEFGAGAMGEAVFTQDTDEMLADQSDDLAGNWQSAGGGRVNDIVILSRPPANPRSLTGVEKKERELQKKRTGTVVRNVAPDSRPRRVRFVNPADVGPGESYQPITLLITHRQIG